MMAITVMTDNSHIATSDISYQNDDNSVQNTYKIYLEQGEDGWIVVTSPDIKSLITQGHDEDNAIRNALEVIDLINEDNELGKDFKLVFYSRISG